ncbi:hypothetical protein [Streptomyces sp. NPDC005438]|uniref:hypothetical protein n=1 Tax=Streptomyces sp. NPDC005438 TaxID=3156880 RepID=UPI0033A6DD82
MKGLLGFLSFAFLASGVTGLLRQWIDWMPTVFGFVRFALPDGYEIPGYLLLISVGVGLVLVYSRVEEAESTSPDTSDNS